ncbi:MAG: peptidylprolyl isomerase [Vibrio sp.]
MFKTPVLTATLVACSLFSVNVLAAPSAIVETNLGEFTIELNQEKAPISVQNFISYAKAGSYNGTIFHRVIPGFMAQGGGFTQEMQRIDVKAPIKNEADNGLKNDQATVAMARTSAPDSATSQFFINFKDNDFLNHSASNAGYAVFGKVTQGFDVVEKMATIPTTMRGMMRDVPSEVIQIKNVTIKE